jgi:hypothetical protein
MASFRELIFEGPDSRQSGNSVRMDFRRPLRKWQLDSFVPLDVAMGKRIDPVVSWIVPAHGLD